MKQILDKNRYSVIPRTLIFVFNKSEQEVLLLKGSPYKRIWANLYNGIGGHIERGEGIITAARRELLEESGLTSLDLHLCGNLIIDTDEEMGIVVFLFKSIYENGKLSSSNEGTLQWILLSDVDNLSVVEDLKVLLPKIAEWRPGDPPLLIHYYDDENGEFQIEFEDLL